jgi:hypothetical protein
MKYVTTTQVWKTILREHMKSAAPIHIPMSKGLFVPEKPGKAPNPSLLSLEDVETIFLFHRWFQLGVTFSDLTPHFPIHFKPVRLSSGNDIAIPSLVADTCSFLFEIHELSDSEIKKIFPLGLKGQQYFLGKDRLIQRYLEVHDSNVICVLRPGRNLLGKGSAKHHDVYFFPDPFPIDSDRRAYTKRTYTELMPEPSPDFSEKMGLHASIYSMATGKAPRYMEDFDVEEYYLGFTEFALKFIRKFIEKRIAALD